ncbi:MAG: rhodanese-like domain-containing protein [Planctomycetes bacterium]|nr:rhodanese-like domain-containing protein [Planctomycetota bacterium]
MSPVRFLAFFVVLAFLAANSPRGNIEFTKDSLEVVKKNVLQEKAVLVDVRSIEEWNQGHIEGSIFLPVTSLRKGGDAKQIAKTLPKKKVLYTFCVVGMRAKTAAYVLEQHGYTVRALKPGYDELIKAGFKKGKNKKKSETSADGNENTRQRNAG